MKKSTVLIVVITFVISVVIVGVFGMQMMSYNTRIYVEEIVPTEVITSSNVSNVKIQKSAEREGEYSVILPYSEGLAVRIDFEIDPADATDGNVELKATNSDAAELARIDGLTVHVLKVGTLRLNYRATDGSGAEITVYLFVLTPDLYYSMMG